MIELKFENNILKSFETELDEVKEELRKTTLRLNIETDNNSIINDQIKNGNFEFLIQQHTKLESFLESLLPAFVKLGLLKNRMPENMAAKFVEIFWNTCIWDGQIKYAMLNRVSDHYRTNVFSPARLCELLDMAGGQISYEAIDLLRSLETNGTSYIRNTIIPHPSSIKRVCAVLDKYENQIVPFHMDKMDDDSEYAEFKPEDIILLMYKAYDLETIAQQRSICIEQSIDAAQIPNRQQVTVYGFKMIDVAARDPKTKKLLYVSAEECSIQSRNNYWVSKIALCGESNVVFNQYRPIMEKVKNLTINKLHNYQPIKSCMDCDLSATWKLSFAGGAMRNKKYACHLCSEKKSEVGQCKPVRCKRFCTKLHKDNHKIKCRHKDILSTENVGNMEVEINQLQEALGPLEAKMNFLIKHSDIDSSEDPTAPISHDKQFKITSEA